MKIGIICEGENTDAPVINEILKHKFPNTSFEIIARDKKAIFTSCHLDINSLRIRQCDHIVVLWDLLPVGKQMTVASQWSEKPNRREQKKMFLEKLTVLGDEYLEIKNTASTMLEHYGFIENSGVFASFFNLKLICVCYAMDGWLLSDERIIKELASTKSHKVSYLSPSLECPDDCRNPAGLLTRVFKNSPNKRFRYYNKYTHNIEIVKKYIQYDRMDIIERSSLSYSRLIFTLRSWGAL